MQLRAKTGFRAIHCRLCRFQQLCSRNKCQCGVIWHHCPSHRTDPAKHLSKKAPKRSKEEQEKRKKAQAQAKAEGSGSRRSTKRKKDPPEVEEGSEAIRKRRGNQRRKIIARNFKLKPMKSIAPLVRCDPARLERIRIREKLNKHKVNMNDKQDSELPACSGSVPFVFPIGVELAEGYRSTPSAPTMATTTPSSREPTRSDISERRANGVYETKQRSQRSDFNRHIMQDINDQAVRAAKRRKVSDHKKPTPPPTRAACRNSSTEPIKGKTHEDQGQRVSEFRTVREKDAIFRLLSRGDRNSEPHAGK